MLKHKPTKFKQNLSFNNFPKGSNFLKNLERKKLQIIKAKRRKKKLFLVNFLKRKLRRLGYLRKKDKTKFIGKPKKFCISKLATKTSQAKSYIGKRTTKTNKAKSSIVKPVIKTGKDKFSHAKPSSKTGKVKSFKDKTVIKKGRAKPLYGVIHLLCNKRSIFCTLSDRKGKIKASVSTGIVKDRGKRVRGKKRKSYYYVPKTAQLLINYLFKMPYRYFVVKIKGNAFKKKKRILIKSFLKIRKFTYIQLFNLTLKSHNGCRLPKLRRK